MGFDERHPEGQTFCESGKVRRLAKRAIRDFGAQDRAGMGSNHAEIRIRTHHVPATWWDRDLRRLLFPESDITSGLRFTRLRSHLLWPPPRTCVSVLGEESLFLPYRPAHSLAFKDLIGRIFPSRAMACTYGPGRIGETDETLNYSVSFHALSCGSENSIRHVTCVLRAIGHSRIKRTLSYKLRPHDSRSTMGTGFHWFVVSPTASDSRG